MLIHDNCNVQFVGQANCCLIPSASLHPLQLITVFTLPAIYSPGPALVHTNKLVWPLGCTVAVATCYSVCKPAAGKHCGDPGCSDCSCCTWNACVGRDQQKYYFCTLYIACYFHEGISMHACVLIARIINNKQLKEYQYRNELGHSWIKRGLKTVHQKIKVTLRSGWDTYYNLML